MAIKHTFRTFGGKMKTSTLTPIRAIREHCVECVQSVYAVADCLGEHCALYPFRQGAAHRGKATDAAPEGQRGG